MAGTADQVLDVAADVVAQGAVGVRGGAVVGDRVDVGRDPADSRRVRDRVGAAAAEHHVGAEAAVERVWARPAGEIVMAIAAEDGGGRRHR